MCVPRVMFRKKSHVVDSTKHVRVQTSLLAWSPSRRTSAVWSFLVEPPSFLRPFDHMWQRCCANFGPLRRRRDRLISRNNKRWEKSLCESANARECPAVFPFLFCSLFLSLTFGFSQITPPFAVAAVTFDGNDTLSLPAGRDPDGQIWRVGIILTFLAKQPAVSVWQWHRFVPELRSNNHSINFTVEPRQHYVWSSSFINVFASFWY